MKTYKNVYIEITDGTDNFTVFPKECVFKKTFCNENLQHEESIVSMTINYEENAFKMLVLSEDVEAYVYDEKGQRLFSGSIRDPLSWEDLGNPHPVESLRINICDYTYKLDMKTTEEIGYLNTELSVIIDRLCHDCGIEFVPSFTGITVPAFVLDAGTSYKTSLDNLLFQYGYAYFFDELGKLRIRSFVPVDFPTQDIDDTEIFTNPKISRLNRKFNKITVKYNSLTERKNELVFFSGGGYNTDETASATIIQKNVYYPFESDPHIEENSGKVYQNFESGYAESYKKYNGETAYRRSSKAQLVYTQNHSVVEDWENGNIIIDREDFGFRQAAVRLLNTGDDDASVYSLSIRADAWYRGGEHSISNGVGKHEYVCDTEYIFTQESALALVNTLTDFFYGTKYKITLMTEREIPCGNFCRLSTGLSGFTSTALAIASSVDAETNIYTTTFITVGFGSILPQKCVYTSYTTKKGEKGDTGAPGTDGKDGKPGKNGGYQDYKFAVGDFGLTDEQARGLDWQDAPPQVPDGQCLYMATKWIDG